MKGTNGDEAGFKWLGTSPERVETTYRVAGQTVDGIASKQIDLPKGDASAEYLIYALKFTDKEIQYYVNDQFTHSVMNQNDGKYPLDADHITFSIWDGSLTGDAAETPDYSKAKKYSAYVDWIRITPFCDGIEPQTVTFEPPQPMGLVTQAHQNL
ncbi:hypothetical protein H4R35_004539 [Dimargaris xerosporica]|nr:hypothetical protein H4R35_004539 [Dimargaris xerosporica]